MPTAQIPGKAEGPRIPWILTYPPCREYFPVMELTGRQPQGDVLAKALEENLWNLWRRFGLGYGCKLHEDPDCLYFDTPISNLPYNAVMRFRAPEEEADARIDAIFKHYQKRGVPFLWLIHPSAEPADLDQRLMKRGFVELENCPGMTMDLADLPDNTREVPPTIHIREATTEDDLEAIYDLIAWRWEVPSEARALLPEVSSSFDVTKPGSGLRCWIAWMFTEPVSKVVLNVHEGVAGIYGVATKPEVRGLGLARSMTLMAFQAAREAGCSLGVLHSSMKAERLYEKIGFRRCGPPFRIFAKPGSFHM